MSLPRHTARTYLQPLREGGSLPAVIETDGGLWVVKFRGAGQGPRTLIAEIIVAEIARRLGLPVPEVGLIELPAGFGNGQPDPEIRELLQASHGINVGLRYMDGAFNFDAAAAGDLISPQLAAEVVWFDALVTNPDRTPRNPNLMVWNREPWLIDHGSALYAHHAWSSVDDARTTTPFAPISQHVLLEMADDIAAADARLAGRLTNGVFASVLSEVPNELLEDPLAIGDFAAAEKSRSRYVDYLERRLEGRAAFVDEAIRARELRLSSPKQKLPTRR